MPVAEFEEALGALRRGLAALKGHAAPKSSRRRFKAIARALRNELESVTTGEGSWCTNAIAARRSRSVVRITQPLMLCSQIQRSGGTLLVCNRMGITFNDVVLQPTYNSISVLSNSSHCLSNAIDVEVTERYRFSATAEQMAAVARQAAPVYAKVSDRFCVGRPG
jgi:hypothetical protein